MLEEFEKELGKTERQEPFYQKTNMRRKPAVNGFPAHVQFCLIFFVLLLLFLVVLLSIDFANRSSFLQTLQY